MADDLELADIKRSESQILREADAAAAALLSQFQFSAEQLSEPAPGSDEKTLFDWQNAPDLEAFGGLEGLAAGLNTSLTEGAPDTPEDRAAREAAFGSNRKPERRSPTYWELIWEGLHDFTLVVLIVAAAVSIVLGMAFEDPNTGWIEGAAILVAVVIVLNVAAVNDMQKERQFRQLSKENDAAHTVTVRRGGKLSELMAEELLVGDLIILANGNKIPADCLFLSGQDVEIDESAMTGESHLAKKSAERPFLISGSEIRKASDVFALVVAVGNNSVQGRAMALLQTESPATPLQSKLEKIATQVSYLGFAVAVVCVVVMWTIHFVEFATGHGTINEETGDPEWASSNWGELLEPFIVGVTVLVVAIPEGLPLAVTISLAYSVKKMMADQNLVRHLDACETMGNATTICSDKTGTLTQNKMTVMQAWCCERFLSEFRTGDAAEQQDFMSNTTALPAPVLDAVVENSLLNASAKYNDKAGKWMGMPTEIALVVYSENAGTTMSAAKERCAVVHTNPFTSSRKRSSVVVRRPDGSFRCYVKGASEMMLRLCDTMVDAQGDVVALDGSFEFGASGPEGSGRKREIGEQVIGPMAGQALRTLALGYRDFASAEDWAAKVLYPADAGKGEGECPAAEDGLTLSCVVGIQDPVRPEVPASVRQCQSAGIVVRMITGDNVATAKAIAKQCNILTETGIAVEGEEFRNRVGGLVLPPHFYHTCSCTDESANPAFRPLYSTADYPEHYGYPAIVGHVSHECESWRAPGGGGSGGDEEAAARMSCTRECKERGCFRKLKTDSPGELEQYKVLKNQAEFDDMWASLQVMARSTPTDKHLFVSGLIERGQVVAVTGDGTNDAPALKKADVGFAMGVGGTDAAKEAADIILLDDNFVSIVKATLWGRNVYDSVRKFLQFQLTVNVVALAVAFIGSCILKESPLTAVQMLWVNLIMDTFASLALATEPPTEALLDRKPYGRDDSLISQTMTRNILGQALFQIIILVVFIFWGQDVLDIPIGSKLGHEALPTQHYAMIFQLFVMMQVFNEINARKINNELNVFEGMFNNPIFVGIVVLTIAVQYALSVVGGVALAVTPLTFEQHLVCLIIGAWSLVMGALIRYVPPKLFTMFGHELIDETRDRKYSFLMRRNSRRSVASVPRVKSSTSL